MDLLKQVSSYVLTPECAEEYFDNLNFLDVPCFKATLSKILGFLLILLALTARVPQILKIMQNKSGAGISVFSISFELTAMLIFQTYSIVSGYPFAAWGDSFFMLVQTLTISCMIQHFAGKTANAVLYAAAFIGIYLTCSSGFVPKNYLWTMQGFNIPIMLFGKLSQAYTNYKNGHTGQLSAATCFIMFGGAAAKIFTSIQETGDVMVILLFSFATLANGVLALQMLYYRNVDVSKIEKSKAKKKKH